MQYAKHSEDRVAKACLSDNVYPLEKCVLAETGLAFGPGMAKANEI